MSRIGWGFALSIFLVTTGHGTPLDDALNIENTKNPLGTIVRDNHGCSLIAPH
jgi:hypothetical protein